MALLPEFQIRVDFQQTHSLSPAAEEALIPVSATIQPAVPSPGALTGELTGLLVDPGQLPSKQALCETLKRAGLGQLCEQLFSSPRGRMRSAVCALYRDGDRFLIVRQCRIPPLWPHQPITLLALRKLATLLQSRMVIASPVASGSAITARSLVDAGFRPLKDHDPDCAYITCLDNLNNRIRTAA